MAPNNIGTITQIRAGRRRAIRRRSPHILNALHVHEKAPTGLIVAEWYPATWVSPRFRTHRMRHHRPWCAARRRSTPAARSHAVGPETLRAESLNVIGEPVDVARPRSATIIPCPILAHARAFRLQSTERRSWPPASRSSTCWHPTPRAARSACFGGARSRQDRDDLEPDQHVAKAHGGVSVFARRRRASPARQRPLSR